MYYTRRRSTEANQTLHDGWPFPGLVHYICIFGSFCPLTEFCQVQTSLCVQVLRSLVLAALLHGTPAAGVSQTLQRGKRNGIIELSQRAPPIFGWAAITLGIGPHSSFALFCWQLPQVAQRCGAGQLVNPLYVIAEMIISVL